MEQSLRPSKKKPFYNYHAEHGALITHNFEAGLKACLDEEHGDYCVCNYMCFTTPDPLPISTSLKNP